jgi:tRNA 5-methylaminomethyl-2-thiouridine biosynthesis bifunctional protein
MHYHPSPFLVWHHDVLPISPTFGDIYYTLDGAQESEYIFIKGNTLNERLSVLSSFHIGELGFGTGLNLLVLLNTLQKTVHHPCHVYYTSLEKHPLSTRDMAKAHHLFPHLEPYSIALLRDYTHQRSVSFDIKVHHCVVSVCLLYGDVLETLPHFPTIDAWFLDGFAPSKNHDMWTEDVFHTMKTKSHLGTTLASFTVAGCVRQGLTHHGFEVQRIKGFGKKRQILIGHYVG